MSSEGSKGLRTWLGRALVILLAGCASPSSPRATDRLPDVRLVDHEGRAVRFVTDLVQDRVVVISFLYTTCTDT